MIHPSVLQFKLEVKPRVYSQRSSNFRMNAD